MGAPGFEGFYPTTPGSPPISTLRIQIFRPGRGIADRALLGAEALEGKAEGRPRIVVGVVEGVGRRHLHVVLARHGVVPLARVEAERARDVAVVEDELGRL